MDGPWFCVSLLCFWLAVGSFGVTWGKKREGRHENRAVNAGYTRQQNVLDQEVACWNP